jgi:hypothetical protein
MGIESIELEESLKNHMIRVVIMASGQEHQEAAAWAAPTYARGLDQPGAVSVLLPAQEEPVDILKVHSKQFGFTISSFDFSAKQGFKYVMQLKCQAFLHAISRLKSDELLFIVDADTCCCKPLFLESKAEAAIFGGKIGLGPDIKNRHPNKPGDPWFVPREQRNTYVNAGVIVTSLEGLDMFALFLDLSQQASFAYPPFGDQTIINFALGKHYRDRLLLLSTAYNEIRLHFSITNFIAHFAGSKDSLEKAKRLVVHRQLCARLLCAERPVNL